MKRKRFTEWEGTVALVGPRNTSRHYSEPMRPVPHTD